VNLPDTTDRKELQRWLLWDTLAYYCEDPKRRATNNKGGCSYLTPDGRQCAIGRLFSKDDAALFPDTAIVSTLCRMPPGDNPALLKLHHMEVLADDRFLGCLQGLHDAGEHWNEAGLTEFGDDYVRSIIREFDLYGEPLGFADGEED
jgi:hypothetical protein